MSCNKCGCSIGGKIGYCMSCWHKLYMTCPKCAGKGWHKRPRTGETMRSARRCKCTACDGRGVCLNDAIITAD